MGSCIQPSFWALIWVWADGSSRAGHLKKGRAVRSAEELNKPPPVHLQDCFEYYAVPTAPDLAAP